MCAVALRLCLSSLYLGLWIKRLLVFTSRWILPIPTSSSVEVFCVLAWHMQHMAMVLLGFGAVWVWSQRAIVLLSGRHPCPSEPSASHWNAPGPGPQWVSRPSPSAGAHWATGARLSDLAQRCRRWRGRCRLAQALQRQRGDNCVKTSAAKKRRVGGIWHIVAGQHKAFTANESTRSLSDLIPQIKL